MKKNLALAFILLVLTVGIKTLEAKRFETPHWKSDYQITEELEDNKKMKESVRTPSSGTVQENQKDMPKEAPPEKAPKVEHWKYEAPKP